MEERTWIVQGDVNGLTTAMRIGICTHMKAVFVFRKHYPNATNIKVEPSIFSSP